MAKHYISQLRQWPHLRFLPNKAAFTSATHTRPACKAYFSKPTQLGVFSPPNSKWRTPHIIILKLLQ